MQVIRVEHPSDGRGIFRSGQSIDLYDLIDRHCQKFPTPYKETGEYIDPDQFCAFKSVEQIQEWITGDEFKFLAARGFVVYLLTLSEWMELTYQVLYRKCHILESKDITEIFIK